MTNTPNTTVSPYDHESMVKALGDTLSLLRVAERQLLRIEDKNLHSVRLGIADAVSEVESLRGYYLEKTEEGIAELYPNAPSEEEAMGRDWWNTKI